MLKNFFLLEYPLDIKPEINIISKQKINKIEKDLNLKIFKEYSQKNEIIENLIKKNNNSLMKSIPRKVKDTAKIHNQLFITTLFKNFCNNTIHIENLDYKDKKCLKFKYHINNLNKQKFKNIALSNTSYKMILEKKKYNLCKIEELLYNIRIKALLLLINRLEIGGKFYTQIFDFCSLKTINFVYLLSLLFKKVLILKGTVISCMGYLGESRISKKELESIINKNIEINPMINNENFMKYLKNQIEFQKEQLENLLKKNFKKYIMNQFINYLTCVIEKDINSKYLYYVKNNFENVFIYLQYKNDKLYKLILNQKKEECKTLNSLIKNKSLYQILEIGLGLGVFADIILKNKSRKLVSIDEQQQDIWKKFALEKINSYLKKEKDKSFNLYQDKTTDSLKKIIDNYGIKYFDLVFIEKSVSFDLFIIQLNLIKKLIRINGYIMFDSMFSLGFFKIIDYIEKNYKDLVRQKEYSGYVYKKIDEIDLNNQNYYAF